MPAPVPPTVRPAQQRPTIETEPVQEPGRRRPDAVPLRPRLVSPGWLERSPAAFCHPAFGPGTFTRSLAPGPRKTRSASRLPCQAAARSERGRLRGISGRQHLYSGIQLGSSRLETWGCDPEPAATQLPARPRIRGERNSLTHPQKKLQSRANPSSERCPETPSRARVHQAGLFYNHHANV